MAKPNPSEELQQQQAIVNEIKQQLQLYNELLAKKKEISQTDFRAQNDLNKQLNQWKDLNKSVSRVKSDLAEAEGELKALSKEAEKAAKAAEKQAKAITELTEDFSELDSLQRSITENYGTQSDETKRTIKNVEAIKAAVSGTGAFLKKNVDLEEDQTDTLIEAAEYLKTMPTSFNKLNKQLSRGSISQKRYNQQVNQLNENWEDILDRIDSSDDRLKGMKKSMKGFGDAAGLDVKIGLRESNRAELKAKQRSIARGGLLSAIPGGEGLNQIFEGNELMQQKGETSKLRGQLMRTAGGAAAGASIAQFAIGMREYIKPLKQVYYYFADKFAPKIAAAEGEVNVQQAIFNRNAKIFGGPLAQKYGSGMFYVAEATKNFQFEMENLANEFTRASKTAFFGHGVGSIGYGAAAMQLAGISAEAVASALNDIASGANVNFFGTKLGAQAAVFSKEMGVSTGAIADIMAAFRRIDGSSGATALNLTYSAAKMADMKGMNIGVILNDMAEASGKLLSYNIQNKDSFVQQAIALREMGGSLPRFAEGMKSSILNFQESMKAQIALSNILNRPVDFSVAQALAYQGKYAEAYENIKQSGVLESVRSGGMIAGDMFSKIFGMSIDEFQARAEKGTSIGLKGTMNAENQSFLQRAVNAQGAFVVNAERIQLDKAILDAEFAKTLMEGLQGDKAYRDAYKTADSLNAAAGAIQNLITGLITGIGALIGARVVGGKNFLGGLTMGAPKIASAGRIASVASSIAPSITGAEAAGLTAGRYYVKGTKLIPEFNASGALNPNFVFGKNMSKNPTIIEVGGAPSFGSKFASSLKGVAPFAVMGAGIDMYSRYQAGQTNTQAIAGSVIPAAAGAGAWALASALAPETFGASLLIPMAASLLTSYGVSKAVDSMTGADQPQPQSVPTSGGGDVLTVLKNIEVLVAEMASAGNNTVDIVLSGKSIVDEVYKKVGRTKGNVSTSTLKQLIAS